MKKEKVFKIKPELYPPNVLIDPEYLKLIENDIERCYPLLRRSDFLNSLLKSYYDGTAGWKKIDEKMNNNNDDSNKKLRQSFK